MPAIKPSRKLDPNSLVGDVAGLMGPLGLPGAVLGVLGKAAKLSPDDLETLQELLGKPIKLGKQLVRLSSADPAKNTSIVHNATTGQRMATPIDELLKAWRSIGEETDEIFPENVVMSEPGTRAAGGTFGPRGGIHPKKRTIPPKATR